MYKSTELRINNDNVINKELSKLLESYSKGNYEIIIDPLILLLGKLTFDAKTKKLDYVHNGDIATCSIAIIDSKYRTGCYQECLNLIQDYHTQNYYPSNKVLPELLRGWCYLVLSRHGQVEEIARNFLQRNIYNNDPEVAASFLFLLGKTQYILHKYNDARQHYSDSLALYRYAGNTEHSCAVLCALGLVEKEVGRLSKSIEYYDKALSLVDSNIYKDRVADICLNKAIALLKHGKANEALIVIKENIASKFLAPLIVAKSMIVNARILIVNNSLNKASDVAHSALSIISSDKYLREEAICLETCGDIELKRNNISTAHMYYMRSEQVARVIDDSSDLLGGIMMRMASFHNTNGNYPEGLEFGKRSMAVLESVGICYDLGILYRIISESYLGLLNFSAAYKYILKSIALLQNHEALRELAGSYLTAAAICCEWHKYYQQSSPIDDALAALVIESYNKIAFDNRTLYEAAWNNALEAHSLYSMHGNNAELEYVEALFKNIKIMQPSGPQVVSVVTTSVTKYNSATLVSYSKSMKSLLSVIEIAANSEEPVLLTGETGTGKELIARIIHERGGRGGAPFIPVNCAAIPEQLFEREFFGNVKGAFTGADANAAGLSEQANGGTLFLDEIGEMPHMLQAKLLRILQDGSYHRLGDPALRRVDIRVLAATNADIHAMVADNKFRPDLYYRLKTLEIHIPPLRERTEDIEPLMSFFIDKMLGDHYRPRDIFDDELITLYYKYPWPGNVRELESITRRLALFAKHNQKATIGMLPKYMLQYASRKLMVGGTLRLDVYLEVAEKERILQALITSGGSRTIAANNLGISRKALYAKMKRLRLEFPV